MNRTQRIAFGVLFLFAIVVAVFALRNPPPPAMPPNADHVWQNSDDCLECHGPDTELPRSPNHPVGLDCMRCHARSR